MRIERCGGLRKGSTCGRPARYRITYLDDAQQYSIDRCGVHARAALASDVEDNLAGWDRVTVEVTNGVAA